MATDNAPATTNVVSGSIGFVRESIDELKKVSHPTRQETIQATLVTIFIVLFVSICLALFDLVCHGIMTQLLP